MKVALLISFVFLQFSSLSQSVSIVDSTGQSVPYATIEVLNKRIALFADINGIINLSSANIGDKDTLIISSIGFNTVVIPAIRVGANVILIRQIKQLPDAFIYNGEWKKENWGSIKKPNDFGDAWQMDGPGSQFARVIKSLNGNKKPAFIYKIAFYTSHARNSQSPVRLRVYEIDKNGLPGNDILTRSVIEKLDKGKGWLEFDLTDDEIRIPEGGLIVAAEYFDTDTSNWNSHKTQYQDSAGKKHKGVFRWYGGNFLTDDETNQGMTMMRYQGEWRKFTFRTSENSNPKNLISHNLVVQVWVRTPE